MKLELKHLAPYLPYGLNLKINTPFGTTDRKFEIDCGHDFNLHLSECNIKPILRPLSDLTKEIEVNGEKFVPYEMLNYKPTIKHVADYPFSFIDLQYISYYSFDCLLEWHFDVFGLIENGLAIDINNLKK